MLNWLIRLWHRFTAWLQGRRPERPFPQQHHPPTLPSNLHGRRHR